MTKQESKIHVMKKAIRRHKIGVKKMTEKFDKNSKKIYRLRKLLKNLNLILHQNKKMLANVLKMNKSEEINNQSIQTFNKNNFFKIQKNIKIYIAQEKKYCDNQFHEIKAMNEKFDEFVFFTLD